MQDYRKLKVWEKAHAVVLVVYGLTRDFPRDEVYTMSSHFRRSAIMIPIKIADACGRENEVEFARHLYGATAACKELDYLLLLARDLGYIPEESYTATQSRVEEVARMLAGLLKSARREEQV
ncbi:MAG: four helix bundle protein [Gemmataceae bacterium]